MGFESIINNAPEFNASILPTERQYRPDLAKSRIFRVFVSGMVFYLLVSVIVGVIWPLASTWYLYFPIAAVVLFLIKTETANAIQSARLANNGRLYIHPNMLQKASSLLENACVLAKHNTYLMSYALYYRAHAYALATSHRKALSLFAANYQSRAALHKHSSTPFLWSLSISQMARCHALMGALPEAEQWQAFAHANADEHWNGPLALTDAIIAARMGRMDVVLKDLQGRWAELEGSLEPWEQRALKLVVAFGFAQMNHNGVKDAEIQQWLGSLHPLTPGEFNYLAANWPELQAFIAEKKL